ncbi:hypothetical protein WUBG_05600 [Wuchereria bancrofti]|uniref:Uncharacterized protein n=1 Tax=Wuchereria bancrofti TaxID=6293 RepID=J9ELX7_WUCBA|nr:hypothetical protein WUBG_05600 [Wuchereria bancrofti]
MKTTDFLISLPPEPTKYRIDIRYSLQLDDIHFEKHSNKIRIAYSKFVKPDMIKLPSLPPSPNRLETTDRQGQAKTEKGPLVRFYYVESFWFEVKKLCSGEESVIMQSASEEAKRFITRPTRHYFDPDPKKKKREATKDIF